MVDTLSIYNKTRTLKINSRNTYQLAKKLTYFFYFQTVLLVYEYSMNPQSKSDRKPARKPNWLGMFNETSTLDKFNKAKLKIDPTSIKLLPMILSALNHNRYLEKLLEDPSTNAPYDKKATTEFSYRKNVFSDAKNWMKMPSKTHSTDYKSGPILSYKPAVSNLEEYKKMRKLRDYHRVFSYFDKMINDKATFTPNLSAENEIVQSENTMTMATIPTKYHKQTTKSPQEQTTQIITTFTPREKGGGNCLCLKKFGLLLNKFVVGIQELISEIMSGKMPCHEEDNVFSSTPTTIETPLTSTIWPPITIPSRSTTKNSLSTPKPRLTTTIKLFTTTNGRNSENGQIQSTNTNYETVTTIYNTNKIKPYNMDPRSHPLGSTDGDLDHYDIQNIILNALLKPINERNSYHSIHTNITPTGGHAEPTEPYDYTQRTSTRPMRKATSRRYATTKRLPIPTTKIIYFDQSITFSTNEYETKQTQEKSMTKTTSKKTVTTIRPPIFTTEFPYTDESTTISAHEYDFIDFITTAKNTLNDNFDVMKLTLNEKSYPNTKGIKPRQFSEKTNNISKNKPNNVLMFRKMGQLVRPPAENKIKYDRSVTSTPTSTSTIDFIAHTDYINLKSVNVTNTAKLGKVSKENTTNIKENTTITTNKLFPYQEGEEENRLANEIDFQEEEILKEVEISLKKNEKIRKKLLGDKTGQKHLPTTLTPILKRNKITFRSMLPKSRPTYLEIQGNNDWKVDTHDYDTNIDLNYDLL